MTASATAKNKARREEEKVNPWLTKLTRKELDDRKGDSEILLVGCSNHNAGCFVSYHGDGDLCLFCQECNRAIGCIKVTNHEVELRKP